MPGIAYAAFTETATFMLDADGICRWIVPASSGHTFSSREDIDSSERCVGAQYVASIDTRVQGGLVELPRVGSSLVFATADETGRISLIRTGTLLRFEVKRKPDSGVHERPVPMGPLASAHSLPTEDGEEEDEPELKTVRFRRETMLQGMVPRRSLPALRPVPRPDRVPAPSPLRGVRSGKLPPPMPPPRRARAATPPSTPRSPEPVYGGLAPREEDEIRKVPVPAAYWPGRRSGRTRRQG